ncbi:hypothetical protein BDV25DRAFT_129299 [Aspergillus avenaceus]|uniref:Uncharacterized protein n=1 Tax=Aspergillus avenaceus TaxID=36643 RepID=A0A5N6TWH3_ASPAV|nr:hypothetical protein BDV25DRAFT_129299 [Aspergillus avenaceus]
MNSGPDPSIRPPQGSMLTELNLTRELHVACLLDNADRVTELLALGADRDAISHTGHSALDIADRHNRVEIIKCLLAHVNIQEAGLHELVHAIHQSRPAVVQALLEMGLNEQLQDERIFLGFLAMACCIGTSTAVIHSLIEHGPTFSISPFEDSFASVAISRGNAEVADTIHEIAAVERQGLNTSVQVRGLDFLREIDPSKPYFEENSDQLFTNFLNDPESVDFNTLVEH